MNTMNTMNTSWVSALMGFDGNQQGSAIGVPGATAAPAPTTTSQTTGTTSNSPALPAQPVAGAGNPFSLAIPMIVMVVLIMGFSWWQTRKQSKQREELMNAMKKGDRVATHSGIIGTVIDMTPEEVVLQVEQGRIRFSRAAISSVLKSNRELADSKVEVKQSTVSV